MRTARLRAMPILALLMLTASCGREVEGGRIFSEPGSSTGSAAPGARTGEPASGRPADRGNVAPAASTTPLFDAHIHYSQDAWTQYTPERAIEILRAAGIRKALVSSTPDTGTQRLHALAPDLVVPMLRPYRSRDDIGAWTRDPTVVAYVESSFRRGVHRGIGEFHIVSGDPATPVIRALTAMAIREDLWLHAHADEHAVAELARSDRRAKVLWAHAGLSSTPQAVRAVLDAHPNIVAELALRGDVMWAQDIDPSWRELFLRYPDRFLVGTDTWTPSRWEEVVSGHERTRGWLAQLPPDVASKIASGNAERLFGVAR
ncbi:MAG: amidohydrolase [Chloroflexota bacterium]|nr:amidohydrolase [Chloroflexota bacterium]